MNPPTDLRVVVVGSGRVGLRTARILDDRGHDVVIVERNPERVENAADAYVATVIEGDATRPRVLEQADLQRSDVLAALTNTMGTNVSVCTMAKRRNPEIRTVMRSVHPEDEEYDGYADAVVFPEGAGARVAVNAIEGGVEALEGLTGDLDLLQLEVEEDAPVAGRALAKVNLPRGSLVVGDAAGDHVATAETELEVGETYLVAAEPAVADEVLQLFRG